MEKIGLHIVIKNGKIVWKHGPTTQKSPWYPEIYQTVQNIGIVFKRYGQL